jgi:hypothetical protein
MVQLGEIINQLYEIDSTLRRAAAALEKLAPQGSERERVALQYFLHCVQNPQKAFQEADWFLAECDEQRVRQAE